MKKILLTLALGFGAMGISSGTAHADLLTYFNFEDSTAAATGPPAVVAVPNLTSDAPGMQTTTITADPTSTGFLTGFAGTVVNVAPGNTQGTNQSLAVVGGTGAAGATGGNNGKYIQFQLSTTGYTGVNLSYATQKTGTGFSTQQLQYSTDGSTFTNFSTYTVAANAPSTFQPTTSTNGIGDGAIASFDLSSVTALNNQTNAYFRLVFSGATNATGNNRLDNIQFNATSATATPEPATWAMMAMGVFAICALQYRRKRSANEVF